MGRGRRRSKTEREQIVKITRDDLIKKLGALDHQILNIWVDDNVELDDDERWEIFAVLLETRVELLKSVKAAGVNLESEMVLPKWLQKMASARQEIRLRDLKRMHEELQHRKHVKTYEVMANLKDNEDS
jgi:hypothetical protein